MVNSGWTLPPQMQTISAWRALLNLIINSLLFTLLRQSYEKALKNLKEKTLFKFHLLVQDVLVNQSENAKGQSRKKGLPKSHKQPWDLF